jgi:hypothetical protein
MRVVCISESMFGLFLVIKFLQGSSKCGFDGENHFVTSEKGTLFKINPGKKEMSIISESPSVSMCVRRGTIY